MTPVLDTESCLDPSPTVHHSLGPIKFDESTNAGNIKILENIFCQQYQLSSEDDFRNRLSLIYGDQKTIARLRSIKARRVEETDPFESLRWVLPIPALFHLKMNLVSLIHKTHFQEKDIQSPSSLAYTRNLLNRKKINGNKADFFALEEFLIHNFQGRIVAAIHAELKTQIEFSFEQLLLSSTPESLNTIISRVAHKLFKPPLSGVTDNTHYNHLHFLRMTLAYQTLKYAIKHGDLSLLRRAIVKSCFYFNGSRQRNYAFETLYLFWLTCTNASSPELQRAILANSLINWRGRKDTWWEIDRGVEIHNGRMKEIIRSRRTPNMDLDYLFEYCALNSAFYDSLQRSLYSRFSIYINTIHPDKPASHDILVIATHVYESMQSTHKGKAQGKSPCRVKDLLSGGTEAMGNALKNFNEKKLFGVDGEDVNIETENPLPQDFFEWNEEDHIVQADTDF